MMKKVIKNMLFVCATVSMVACGGGGSSGGGASAAIAAGMWTGVTDTGQEVIGFVLPSGAYYMFYGDESVSIYDSMVGAVMGKGKMVGADVFKSSGTLDAYYNGEWDEGTVLATVVEKQTFIGTATSDFDGTTREFTLAYDPKWEAAPLSLASIAGEYEDGDGEIVTVAADGSVTYEAGLVNCRIEGELTVGQGPLYNLTAKTTGSGCAAENLAGYSVSGVFYAETDIIVTAGLSKSGDEWILYAGDRVIPK